MSGANYNSTRKGFIGWGLPQNGDLNKTIGEPKNFTGALVYNQDEEQLYYSTGTDWKSPENPPIKRPYALEPSTPEDQSKLRLSNFLAGQGYEEQFWQMGVIFEFYLDEKMTIPIDLSPGYPTEDETLIKSRTYKIFVDGVGMEQSILGCGATGFESDDYLNEYCTAGLAGDHNPNFCVAPIETDTTPHWTHIRYYMQLPAELYDSNGNVLPPGTTFYWRGKYLANGGQESLFSVLFKQQLPDLISTPIPTSSSNVSTGTISVSPYYSAYNVPYYRTKWIVGTRDDGTGNVGGTILFDDYKQGTPENPELAYSLSVLNGVDGLATFKDGNTYYWQAKYEGQDAELGTVSSGLSSIRSYIQPSANAILTIDTTKTDQSSFNFTIHNAGITYINWGDTQSTTINQRPDELTGYEAQHTYTNHGSYNITIYGNVTRIYVASPNLVEVKSFGKTALGLERMRFSNCTNLTKVADYIPPTLWDLNSCFANCTKFNQDLKYWNVSNVYNFSSMFSGATVFNGDISTWRFKGLDLEYPLNFTNMFYNATSFNKSISQWNVDFCVSMAGMFYNTKAFSQSLRDWNTKRVTNMSNMFAYATAFDGDISNWNTSNVTTMYRMFYGATTFTRDLTFKKEYLEFGASDAWNTSNVTDFTEMFAYARKFNGNIENWNFNANAAISMAGMFRNADKFNRDISMKNTGGVLSWNTNNVTNMSNMFNSALRFNANISNWNTSNTTSLAYMFAGTEVFNQDIKYWDYSNVTDMSYMFFNCKGFRKDLDNINVANCTNFTYMLGNHYYYTGNVSGWKLATSNTKNISLYGTFYYCTEFDSDISNWDVTRVTNLGATFYGATKFNQNIGLWGSNTKNITSLSATFAYAYKFNQNINTWDTSNNTTLGSTFFRSVAFNQSLNSWDTSKVTSLAATFYGATNFNGAIGNWNTANVTSLSTTFYTAYQFNQNISNWNTAKVTDLTYTFSYSKFNQNIPTNGNIWNTSNVTSLYYTFLSTPFNGNISNWNVSKVTNMQGTFQSTPFNSNVSSWNVSNVVVMNQTFNGATSFNIDIGSWNVSNVVYMDYMFQNAQNFNKDIGNWNVSKVNTMYAMFYNAYKFNQDISSWNTSSVIDMGYMFCNAIEFGNNATWSINYVVSNNYWNTSNVQRMHYMFYGARRFNQNIAQSPTSPGWNVSKVYHMAYMFYGASYFNQNLSSWNISKVVYMNNMFVGCGLSTDNYSSTLIGWGTRAATYGVIKNVLLNASAKYTYSAKFARDTLTNATWRWTITDGGLTT